MPPMPELANRRTKPATFTIDALIRLIRPFFHNPVVAAAALLAGIHQASAQGELAFAFARRDLAPRQKVRLILELARDALANSRLLRLYAYLVGIKAINALGNRVVINKSAPRPIMWRDHVVVITGGARGILGETARMLARKGAKVAVLDMAPKSDHGTERLYVQTDVTSEASLIAAKKRIETELGLCTMLIAGAGLGRHGFLLDPPEVFPTEYATEVSDVNLHGVVATLKVFGQDMLPDGGRREGKEIKQARNGWGGHILILGSGAAFVELPGNGTYNASKAGAVSLHHTLSTELEAWHNVDNVRNSVICPLKVESPMTDGMMKDTDNQFLLPTLIIPEVAAKIVSMLEEDKSRMVFMPRAAYVLSYIRNLPPWLLRLSLRGVGAFETFLTYSRVHRTADATK
ncbi:uncharacterized protein PFL1_05531 [Pseudozyma flocculosa PF-1]|uniref:Uncharacterized protein n=1 Tax=Pseudozyma flocculosa PF-1 TaxID=1277687 RepID=A0A061H8I1_9BASI|nr:uncharacterized protein PFL1_05531 [Pseudozyma flocculosa PF-1]EPQ26896.1 hypothetical protein PFL1_05531 [Pseudozyma flocculosa PF-1]